MEKRNIIHPREFFEKIKALNMPETSQTKVNMRQKELAERMKQIRG